MRDILVTLHNVLGNKLSTPKVQLSANCRHATPAGSGLPGHCNCLLRQNSADQRGWSDGCTDKSDKITDNNSSFDALK